MTEYFERNCKLQTNKDTMCWLSNTGHHRYWLSKRLTKKQVKKTTVWLMLNPSKATAKVTDLTFLKCIGFSKNLGAHELIIVNLFAMRSTSPLALWDKGNMTNIIGYHNDYMINKAITRANHGLIFAFGQPPNGSWAKAVWSTRVVGCWDIAKSLDKKPMCLGKTKDGWPRHPSRLAYDTDLEKWKLPKEMLL